MSAVSWWKRSKDVDFDALRSTVMAQEANRYRLSVCPVTCNLPTRMTRESFTRRCEGHQDVGGYCAAVCQGRELPPGLEFIDLKKHEEDNMSGVPGVCEVCQENKTVKMIHGKECCSVCEIIWRGSRMYPRRLVDLLLTANGDSWMIEEMQKRGVVATTGPVKAVAEDFARERELELIAESARVDLANVYKLLGEARNSAAELLKTVADEIGVDVVGLDIATEVSILKQENNRLREQLDEAALLADSINTDYPDYGFRQGSLASSLSSRDGALLDLALEVMDGKVVGIDAERLRSLR